MRHRHNHQMGGSAPGVQVAGGGGGKSTGAFSPNAIAPELQAIVDRSTSGALIKHLVEVAHREDALLAQLATACASNNNRAIIAAARSMVAGYGQTERVTPHNCAA